MGLTNGVSYAFSVYATNAYGNSGGSVLSNFVIPAVATVAATDQYFTNVVFLLQGTGANASTTIVDSSLYRRPTFLSAVDADISVSNTTAKFGSTSLRLNGYSNGGHIRSEVSNDFVFDNDFTIEFFANKTANSAPGYDYILSTAANNYGDGGWYVSLYDGSQGFAFGCGRLIVLSYTATTLTDGVWHHYAITRKGSILRLFVDGVIVATHNAYATTLIADYPLKVGQLTPSGGQGSFNGYVDDLRITKGIARYISDFAAPSQPIAVYDYCVPVLLHCNGVENSTIIRNEGTSNLGITSNNVMIKTGYGKFSDSCLWFDAANAGKVVIAGSNAIAAGTGDFTAEAWIYPTQVGGLQVLMGDVAWSAGYRDGWYLAMNGSNLVFCYGGSYSAWAEYTTATAPIVQAEWCHTSWIGRGCRRGSRGRQQRCTSQGACPRARLSPG
jgi:hypothetical protein